MATDRAESMRHARRIDSERKRRLVLAATDAQLEAGRHPTIAGIARAAGVGRKFIYDHPDLKADIELRAAQATNRQANDIASAARVTGASLRGRSGELPGPEPPAHQAGPSSREPALQGRGHPSRR